MGPHANTLGMTWLLNIKHKEQLMISPSAFPMDEKIGMAEGQFFVPGLYWKVFFCRKSGSDTGASFSLTDVKPWQKHNFLGFFTVLWHLAKKNTQQVTVTVNSKTYIPGLWAQDRDQPWVVHNTLHGTHSHPTGPIQSHQQTYSVCFWTVGIAQKGPTTNPTNEPGTLSLWGVSANHCTTVSPLTLSP